MIDWLKMLRFRLWVRLNREAKMTYKGRYWHWSPPFYYPISKLTPPTKTKGGK